MTITNSCPLIIFLCFMMPLFVFCDEGMHSAYLMLAGPSTQILLSFHQDRNGSVTVSVKADHAHSRKVWLHGSCTSKDISISQSKSSTSGIPQFIVQIVNTCVSECAPRDIHLHCGWFASARIVNPRLFKRLSFDDCLVNGGNPLASSQIIRFTYSNSFMYPLAFKSAKFC
ncbi:TPD1 protein-like 1, partial [Mucuna pruriens]